MIATKEAKGLRLIFGYLGLFLAFEGVAMLFPLIVIAYYRSEWQCIFDFIIPCISAIVIGLTLYFVLIAFRKKGKLQRYQDSLLLVLLWISAILLGSFPFYLSSFPEINFGNADISLGLTFTESIFEATSGFTATGTTVVPNDLFLVGVDTAVHPCSHVFLFHRAWMQFIGGIGLVLLVTSLISSRNNLRLYLSEGHSDQVVPNLAKSAKLIFLIYSGWVAFGTLTLWLSGMTVFDAFCHSAAALATGGFSTRAGSIVWYTKYTENPLNNGLYTISSLGGLPPSFFIELVTCILMLAGATNFLLHTFLIRGKFREFFRDIEFKTFFWLILFATIIIGCSLLYLYVDPEDPETGATGLDGFKSFRYAIYCVITAITTTGFTNYASFKSLGAVAYFVAFVLIAIGGGMGSTAGGLKQYRFGLLVKNFFWNFKYRFSSSNTINPHVIKRFGDVKEMDPDALKEAQHFLIVWISFFAMMVLVCSFLPGLGFQDAFYEVMDGMSGTGMPYLDFASYKSAEPAAYPALLWLVSFCMLFGRLEIVPMFFAGRSLFVEPIIAYRKKKRRESKTFTEIN